MRRPKVASERITIRIGIAVVLGFTFGAFADTSREEAIKYVLKVGPAGRPLGPIRLEIPAGAQVPTQVTDSAGKTYTVQRESSNSTQLIVLLPDQQPGTRLELTLPPDPVPTKIPLENQPMAMFKKANDEKITISISGKRMGDYLVGPKTRPNLWPVMGPGGQALTRSYPQGPLEPGDDPKEHPHHRSFWFTHGDVNGIDFWTEGAKRGRQLHRRWRTITSGVVFGELTHDVDWVAPDGKVVMKDIRTLRVYNLDQPERIIDFTVTLMAPTADSVVVLGDTKEGTFATRVNLTMSVESKSKKGSGAKIINANGLSNAAAWGQPARWCDYSGPQADGTNAGLTIFDHQSNVHHPARWHVRGYGLFAANPLGAGHFTGEKIRAKSITVTPDRPLTLQYRTVLHGGKVTASRLDGHWNAWHEPALKPSP